MCHSSCLLEKREGIYSDETRWVTKKIKKWHIISYSHPFALECYRRRLCRISQSWKMLKKMIGRTKQKLLTRGQGDCSRVKMGKRLWFRILWMFEPLNTFLGRLHAIGSCRGMEADSAPWSLTRQHIIKFFKDLCIQYGTGIAG